jgi:hypothetical protein
MELVGIMELAEALISFTCLVSLIVILVEAQRNGGFRRRWAIAVWAGSLFAMSMVTFSRVILGSDSWSDARILMGLLAGGNFLFGGALLIRWLFGAPR